MVTGFVPRPVRRRRHGVGRLVPGAPRPRRRHRPGLVRRARCRRGDTRRVRPVGSRDRAAAGGSSTGRGPGVVRGRRCDVRRGACRRARTRRRRRADGRARPAAPDGRRSRRCRRRRHRAGAIGTPRPRPPGGAPPPTREGSRRVTMTIGELARRLRRVAARPAALRGGRVAPAIARRRSHGLPVLRARRARPRPPGRAVEGGRPPTGVDRSDPGRRRADGRGARSTPIATRERDHRTAAPPRGRRGDARHEWRRARAGARRGRVGPRPRHRGGVRAGRARRHRPPAAPAAPA